jgi:16S rRNA (cytosine967-C5)-methyltransferase
MLNNSRRAAAFAILRWILTKEFPDSLLPNGPDRAFVQDIVYTTIRRLRPLRYVLGKLVTKWPKGEMEALLYVGAAQILYMPDVPDFAAVNETVMAAKMCGNPSIPKVVNGVLRNLIRRRDEFKAELLSADLALRESFPEVIVKRWIDRYSEEGAAKLCAWHNTPAETFLARRDGSFVALERGKRVNEVAGYQEGEFIVQDPGTQIAIRLLDIKPGESVLDACAAPGGKTIQIAWRGANVTACEVNPNRRKRLQANLERLGVNVPVLSAIPQAGTGSFDKVLVDAPCSNTGVIRRRPDVRWNWTIDKLSELIKLQSSILESAALLVSPGGRLVYSTCSNEPEENIQQVEAFLKRHPEFELESTEESIPYETQWDGAFAAALIRR